MLEIRLLGQFDIRLDGRPVRLASRRAQSLLAYLLLAPGVQQRREKVAGQLWPDLDETKARSRLRYSLWQLRQALGSHYFPADRVTIRFDPGLDLWLDIALIDRKTTANMATGELAENLSVYEGELLPGFYDEWIVLERERLQAIFENKMQQLLQRLIDEARWPELLEWGERWIALGQSPETAFRALMIAHGQLGDVSGAVAVYQRCQKSLREQLGVEPSHETRQVYERIARGEKPIVPPSEQAAPLRGSPPAPDRPPFLQGEKESPEFQGGIFVTREHELRLLENRLESTLSGSGTAVFVIGDAGRGKTTLLQEFSQRAQRRHDNLVVAFGSGEAHTGIGDPHLVFRDVLALLSGDVEARLTKWSLSRSGVRRLWDLIPQVTEALLAYGPDLIDSFVPGEPLRARGSAYAPEGEPWLDRLERLLGLKQDRPVPINVEHGDVQKDLFAQYTRVLQQLAKTQPLLLILDDLQWADLGSVSLLFHLCRRIEGHRIMIAGAFRSDVVVPGRDGEQHPLLPVLTELKRTVGEIELDLDLTDEIEGRQFVDAILDTEPNKLGRQFRQALYRHAAGHPLFTVELIRQLKEQGDLHKDGEGMWVEGPVIGWDALPARVEAVIKGRIYRLPGGLRDILRVACVEGELFTAEVIARVMGMTTDELVGRLSRELDKSHLLVEAVGIQQVGQHRLAIYRFRHHLFQKYLYDNLDEIERTHLHESVGQSLEVLYGQQTGQFAVRLARHYEAAGVAGKAIDYLLQAGDQAKRLSANKEAIDHFTRGLRLIPDLPDDAAQAQKELALQIALGAPLVAIHGWAAPEVEAAYERARVLCERTGDREQLTPALWGLWSYYLVRGRYATAREQAAQILDLARDTGGAALSLVAHWTLGITLVHIGQFASARTHLEHAVGLYDAGQHRPLTFLYGQNPGVTCLSYLAITLWFLGYADQALERSRQAIALAEDEAHPFSLSFAYSLAAVLHGCQQDAGSALASANKTIDLSSGGQFPFLMALALVIRGWARAEQRSSRMATKLIQKGLMALERTGAELGRPLLLYFLAEAQFNGGQFDQGLEAVHEALDTANRNDERLNEADLYRLKGTLLAELGGSESEILACYNRAMEIAQQQEARAGELRALAAKTDYLDRFGRQPGAMPSTNTEIQ